MDYSEEDSTEYEIDQEYDDNEINVDFDKLIDEVLKTRIKMLNYCKENILPLCENMDSDTFLDFIDDS